MSNIHPHHYIINKEDRIKLMGHPSVLIWFTGLSGSGKSTIANILEKKLFEKGIHTLNLDGDNIRSGLNADLGFEDTDRTENLRRIAEISKIILDSGLVLIGAFVSPFEKDRKLIKNIVGAENFIEIFVNTSLAECEKRDVKGLYAKARSGQIKNFTGIDSPYERPIDPDLEITMDCTPDQAADQVIDLLKTRKIIQ